MDVYKHHVVNKNLLKISKFFLIFVINMSIYSIIGNILLLGISVFIFLNGAQLIKRYRDYYKKRVVISEYLGDDTDIQEMHLEKGKLHRVDGPAAITFEGTKVWKQYGEYHRVDGPAIEWFDGRKSYYIEGVQFEEEQFKRYKIQQELKLYLKTINQDESLKN